MADKIKAIKIKQKNGTYSEEVPISVNVQNVQWDENNHTLLDALGSVDISSSGKGNLQHQIDELDGDKISTNQFNSRLNDFLKDQISADTTDWLDDNVNPVGSAVIVDKTLTIEGAAADALAVKTELNKKANTSNTYTKAEVNAAIDAKKIEVDDTLSITGTAADAKAVGDELTEIKADLVNAGMSSTAKAALLACLRNVVWTSGQGKTYYDALASAFSDDIYPQIRVTFSPVTTKIYSDDALDTLKTYLTVKYYENSQSSGTVVTASNYTLSGELVDGENSIVVATYGGCTKPFLVPVESFYNKYRWSLADGDFEMIFGTVVSKAGNGMAIGNANNRLTAVVEHGKRTYVKNADGSDMGVYPIPVPPNATKVKVSIYPSSQYISFGLRALLETGYYRGWADKWLDYTEGEIELDFTEWKVENLYLSITTKYDSAGSTYPTAPTDLVIVFED